MKKTNLVLGFMLIMLLALSTGLMANGTEPTGNPREVSTLDHLLWISTTSSCWGDDFIQTADIDAAATMAWNSGAGFSPIGHYNTKFTGSYDGNGKTISDLCIRRSSTDYIGLFGFTSGATISDLGVTNVDIEGYNHVGGLVGYNENSTVSNSYSTGSVSGNGQVGGLVGLNNSSSTVENSYSTGSVSGNWLVGGLLGYNVSSTVINSYYTGDVTRSSGTNAVFGGFCGRNYGAIIRYCYSTGSVFQSDGVTALGTANGFISENISGTYANNFWDSGASNQLTATGATAKTTTQMKTQSTFTDAGWDFVDIWAIDGATNDGYPNLDGGDDPLPVNLSSFYATYIGGTPTLYWTTQSEESNDYWNVYRGTNDNFETAAQINAEPVPGNGTTNSASDYIYVDTVPVVQNTTYWYWIEDVSTDGETEIHEPITLTVPLEDTPEIPLETGLHQNYPNPFNPSTTISFTLTTESTEKVEIEIFNVKGQNIRTYPVILSGVEGSASYHSIIWDGKDENGKAVSSGVYFYKLITDTKEYQRKMLLVK